MSDWTSYVIDDSNQGFPLDSNKDTLSKFIVKRDQDIEDYISQHDEQFLKISNSTSLNFYSNINQYIAELSSVLTNKHEEEESINAKKVNLELMQDHIHQMDKIIDLLELYEKGNIYLKESLVFKALGVYKQVKQSPLIKRFSFLKQLIKLINDQEKIIISKANSLVKEWLVILRQSAPKIGEKGILVNKQMQLGVSNSSASQSDLMDSLPNKLTQLWQSVQDMNFLDISGLVYVIKEIHDSDIISEFIDFNPLFKTIYTYDLLDSKPELIHQFESDRAKQAELLIPNTLTLKNLENTFNDIAGFYLIEEEILRQTSQFRTKSGVELLWKETQSVLDKKLKVIINQADTHQLIEIKNKLSIFVKTIELYGFYGDLQSFDHLFELFCERMKTACSQVLLTAIEEDNYSPYLVTDGIVLQEISQVIPINIEDYLTFPAEMPFSSQVVVCSRETLDFVKTYLLFLDDTRFKRNDVDEILQKFIDNLFIYYINSPLKTEAQKSSNLTQLTVIWKNLIFYSFICKNLQLLLEMGKISTKSHGIRLSSINSLEETRQVIENKLERKVYERISQFLELSNYELMPRIIEPTSSYIKDLTRFLEDILGSVFGTMKVHLKPLFFQKMLDIIVDYLLVGNTNLGQLLNG
eukprot:NODE_508_length_7458_cov_0.132491.p1 type:complete len:639 gc:universal NODE_508_length_7458_cov_0.132491:100-2016(+)